MVQVASLRIQIEANQAKQAAQEVRRELDAVTVAATKTEVSTDKLERQMAELLAVNKAVALNTHASAVAIQQLGQRQATTAVHVERTTEKLVKQETAGRKLSLMFGGLAARTAATGGAFLAADFLARVAGANSLMDGMNKILNTLAESFRKAFVQADSFAEAIIKAGNAKPVSDADLAALIGGAASKSSQFVGGTVFPRTQIPLNLPKAALENEALLGGISKELAEFDEDLTRAARSYENAIKGQTPAARADLQRRFEDFKVFRAGEAQRDIDRLSGFFADMAATAQRAAEAVSSFNKTLAATASVAIGGPRSAAGIAGGKAFAAAGFPGTSPAGIGIGLGTYGVDAAQRYAQAQGYRGGTFSSSDASPGGNFFVQSMASAAAASGVYAANLVKIIEQQERAARSARQFGESAAGAFEDAVFSSGTLEDRIEGLISSLTRAVFNILVTQQLASAIGGFFGGGGGGSLGGQSAKGNVFSMGSLVPFAAGGIVHGPTVFPMSGGKTGLMGEAGPEAIMPLGRNSKGELGVKGGSTVNFYISTPDVEGFRKSRKQISADLRRMVS